MQRGSGVTGNQETGLFTAAGRDRVATGTIGGAGHSGGGGGRGGGRGGGGPMRDNGRKRGGKRMPVTLKIAPEDARYDRAP